MKVFAVLITIPYETVDLDSIWDNEEGANKRCAELNAKDWHRGDDIEVVEYELNKVEK